MHKLNVDGEFIATVRADIAARLESGGGTLRGIARDVGMSPAGLRKFLDGTDPYRPTYVRLSRWHAAHQQAGALNLMDYLLEQVAETFPVTARAEVTRELHDTVSRLRARLGPSSTAPPRTPGT